MPESEGRDVIRITDITMKQEYTILIADRNPHVRAFLKREMENRGYQILLAGSGHEVLKWVFGTERLHLLIIDPDLPDVGRSQILKELQNRIPPLPTIIHSFSIENDILSATSDHIAFVEKGGESIERLKQISVELLKKVRPEVSKTVNGKRSGQGD